jgi:hypothetical protein
MDFPKSLSPVTKRLIGFNSTATFDFLYFFWTSARVVDFTSTEVESTSWLS